MKINIIYKAIEGEGLNVGTPQLFIRTQGCKLASNGSYTNCINCDTKNSWDFNAGIEMTVQEVFQKVIDSGLDRVSITGGNPIFAKGIEDLVELLWKRGFWVNIEVTGQDFNSDVFNLVDFISCDIKTPSTGVVADLDNIKRIIEVYGHKTQLKCVCADQKDLDFIIDCYKSLRDSLDNPLVITPCFTEDDDGPNTEFIEHIYKTVLDNNYNLKVICQIHKLLLGSRRVDI